MTSNRDQTRRDFIKVVGMGTAASLAWPRGDATPGSAAAAESTGRASGRPLHLALASYTLRKFDLDAALAMTARAGLEAICLKSFHLPLDATADEIAAAAAKVQQAGIRLYGGGVISMNNLQQVDQAFQYAKTAGMSKIIAAPRPDMLPRINDLVQQYDIAVCIHNHGPGDKHFPTPETAYAVIRELDNRVGLCHDIGHTVRYGADPIAQTRQCADRLLDVHLKDVTAATEKGSATPCGRGVIDLAAMIRTLLDIGFTGWAAFEYEADADDPLPGLAESVGYIHGILDALAG